MPNRLSVDKSLYIITLKQSTFDWDEAEEEAFQRLKKHLATPFEAKKQNTPHGENFLCR